MDPHIKTMEEMESLVEGLRDQGKTIITTNGSFDILHTAHINLFKKAKKLGDVLIVLLNDDDSIKRNKGASRPIVPEDERAFVVSELKSVDYVALFNEDKPLNYLRVIKPNVHVKGGSWDPDRLSEEKSFIENLGGEYRTFELEAGLSTTNIIEKILDKDVS
jgi:rfaE bifunctional protein nucleotidyltransferase chain/domain